MLLLTLRSLGDAPRLLPYLSSGQFHIVRLRIEEEELLEALDAWTKMDEALAHPSFAATLACVKIEFDSLLDLSSLAESGRFTCVDQWKRQILPRLTAGGFVVLDCNDECDLH